MSQGSFSPKFRFLGQKVSSVARRQTDTKVKHKNDPKNVIFQNFEKQKNAFLSHVPRILQSKNQVSRPKVVLCSSETHLLSENGPKNHIFQNFEKQKNAFLSHVPRTLQSKNQVPRPKGVLCSSDTHLLSENGPKYHISRCKIATSNLKPNMFYCYIRKNDKNKKMSSISYGTRFSQSKYDIPR